MVVAMLALVVAASGTAVAATNLSAGDSLIKKNSLSGNRLKNHSVTWNKIKQSSVGTVKNADHATNADNATNAANATKATTAGAAPVASLAYVTTPFTIPNTGNPATDTATCPAGTFVTGGGTSINDTTNGFIVASYPAGKTGWTGVFEDFGPTPTTAFVYAICAPAATTTP
jgi:hypothetical protein